MDGRHTGRARIELVLPLLVVASLLGSPVLSAHVWMPFAKVPSPAFDEVVDYQAFDEYEWFEAMYVPCPFTSLMKRDVEDFLCSEYYASLALCIDADASLVYECREVPTAAPMDPYNEIADCTMLGGCRGYSTGRGHLVVRDYGSQPLGDISLNKRMLREPGTRSSSHGTCVGLNECLCKKGWKGDDCSVADCGDCPLPYVCEAGACVCPATHDLDPLTNECVDCSGEVNGSHVRTECGHCVRAPYDITFVRYKLDACGICNGNGSSCIGCDGVDGSNARVDSCGICDGCCVEDALTSVAEVARRYTMLKAGGSDYLKAMEEVYDDSMGAKVMNKHYADLWKDYLAACKAGTTMCVGTSNVQLLYPAFRDCGVTIELHESKVFLDPFGPMGMKTEPGRWVQLDEGVVSCSEDKGLTKCFLLDNQHSRRSKMVVTSGDMIVDCQGYQVVGTGYHGVGIIIGAGAKNVQIRNCMLSNFSIGILVTDTASNVLVENCDIMDNAHYGIHVRGISVENITIANNHIVGNGVGIGILNTAGDVHVFRNRIRGNVGAGVAIHHASQAVVHGNSIIGNKIGIRVHGYSEQNRMYHNLLEGSKWADAFDTTYEREDLMEDEWFGDHLETMDFADDEARLSSRNMWDDGECAGNFYRSTVALSEEHVHDISYALRRRRFLPDSSLPPVDDVSSGGKVIPPHSRETARDSFPDPEDTNGNHIPDCVEIRCPYLGASILDSHVIDSNISTGWVSREGSYTLSTTLQASTGIIPVDSEHVAVLAVMKGSGISAGADLLNSKDACFVCAFSDQNEAECWDTSSVGDARLVYTPSLKHSLPGKKRGRAPYSYDYCSVEVGLSIPLETMYRCGTDSSHVAGLRVGLMSGITRSASWKALLHGTKSSTSLSWTNSRSISFGPVDGMYSLAKGGDHDLCHEIEAKPVAELVHVMSHTCVVYAQDHINFHTGRLCIAMYVSCSPDEPNVRGGVHVQDLQFVRSAGRQLRLEPIRKYGSNLRFDSDNRFGNISDCSCNLDEHNVSSMAQFAAVFVSRRVLRDFGDTVVFRARISGDEYAISFPINAYSWLGNDDSVSRKSDVRPVLEGASDDSGRVFLKLATVDDAIHSDRLITIRDVYVCVSREAVDTFRPMFQPHNGLFGCVPPTKRGSRWARYEHAGREDETQLMTLLLVDGGVLSRQQRLENGSGMSADLSQCTVVLPGALLLGRNDNTVYLHTVVDISDKYSGVVYDEAHSISPLKVNPATYHRRHEQVADCSRLPMGIGALGALNTLVKRQLCRVPDVWATFLAYSERFPLLESEWFIVLAIAVIVAVVSVLAKGVNVVLSRALSPKQLAREGSVSRQVVRPPPLRSPPRPSISESESDVISQTPKSPNTPGSGSSHSPSSAADTPGPSPMSPTELFPKERSWTVAEAVPESETATEEREVSTTTTMRTHRVVTTTVGQTFQIKEESVLDEYNRLTDNARDVKPRVQPVEKSDVEEIPSLEIPVGLVSLNALQAMENQPGVKKERGPLAFESSPASRRLSQGARQRAKKRLLKSMVYDKLTDDQQQAVLRASCTKPPRGSFLRVPECQRFDVERICYTISRCGLEDLKSPHMVERLRCVRYAYPDEPGQDCSFRIRLESGETAERTPVSMTDEEAERALAERPVTEAFFKTTNGKSSPAESLQSDAEQVLRGTGNQQGDDSLQSPGVDPDRVRQLLSMSERAQPGRTESVGGASDCVVYNRHSPAPSSELEHDISRSASVSSFDSIARHVVDALELDDAWSPAEVSAMRAEPVYSSPPVTQMYLHAQLQQYIPMCNHYLAQNGIFPGHPRYDPLMTYYIDRFKDMCGLRAPSVRADTATSTYRNPMAVPIALEPHAMSTPPGVPSLPGVTPIAQNSQHPNVSFSTPQPMASDGSPGILSTHRPSERTPAGVQRPSSTVTFAQPPVRESKRSSYREMHQERTESPGGSGFRQFSQSYREWCEQRNAMYSSSADIPPSEGDTGSTNTLTTMTGKTSTSERPNAVGEEGGLALDPVQIAARALCMFSTPQQALDFLVPPECPSNPEEASRHRKRRALWAIRLGVIDENDPSFASLMRHHSIGNERARIKQLVEQEQRKLLDELLNRYPNDHRHGKAGPSRNG